MNGVLLFGWSTAVIFEVLRRAMAETPPGFPMHRASFPAKGRASRTCWRERRDY
jgi:hypothetical protein